MISDEVKGTVLDEVDGPDGMAGFVGADAKNGFCGRGGFEGAVDFWSADGFGEFHGWDPPCWTWW